MSLTKQLQTIGLDARSAKAYLALLELGEASMADLAKKSKIQRTTLYDVVQHLKNEGLVSVFKKGGRTFYSAEDPRTLDERLVEKRKALADSLPQLLSLANALDTKPKIRFYEGMEGIKEVYRDTLEHPDQELLAWVTDSAVAQFDLHFLNDIYLPKRVAKKIWVRAILPDVPHMRSYTGKDAMSLRTTKTMDHKRFPFAVEINLYGGKKVAFMSFKESMGLIIESESIYSTLKSIFEGQWEVL